MSMKVRPYWGRVIHSVDHSQIILKTISGPSNKQCQHAVRTRVRPYRGSEWGTVWTRHRFQWGTNTGSCEEQSPMQWGKALCILTLVLTRGWLWTSLGTDSGPHYMLTVILTKAWLLFSLWPDSHPHCGWKFSSSGLVSANTMLKNLFLCWMNGNK